MTGHDDDLGEMGAGTWWGTGGREADRVVADPDDALMGEFLGELRALAVGPAPAPSAELLAAFDGAVPITAVPGRTRARRPGTRRRALSFAVAAATVTGLVGVAAANHDLPAPAQRLVARVVEVLTPFRLDPTDRVRPRPSPAVPVPPSPAATTPVQAAPSPPAGTPVGGEESPGSGGHGSGGGSGDGTAPGGTGSSGSGEHGGSPEPVEQPPAGDGTTAGNGGSDGGSGSDTGSGSDGGTATGTGTTTTDRSSSGADSTGGTETQGRTVSSSAPTSSSSGDQVSGSSGD